VPSARHALEVNYYDYRRLLKRLIRLFDKRLKPPGQGALESLASPAGLTIGGLDRGSAKTLAH
jgi:hypothetical protein